MSNRISYILLFSISLVATLLYWPVFNGTPIWDDFSFLFEDPVMRADFSYFTIWKNFAWPMSVSLQKLAFSLFEQNYTSYHILNFIIHLGNGYLVYKLAKKLNLLYPTLIFALFILHPTNYISVAWIIQLKTLLCFTFSILSVLFFLDVLDPKLDWKKLSLSYGLFAAAILSKSAALPLVCVFFILGWKFIRMKKLLFILPYLLLTSWGAYKLFASPVTQKTTKQVEMHNVAPEVSTTKALPESIPPAITVETKDIELPKEVTQSPPSSEVIKTTNPNDVKSETSESNQIIVTPNPQEGMRTITGLRVLPKTLYYYFWQAILPMENAPIKGMNFLPLGFNEYLHLFFLLILFILSWKLPSFYYLAGFHLLLTPFLGLVPAPYMNITWVSDQHLYLALPFILFFIFSTLERIKFKRKFIIPLVLLPLFIFKDFQTAKFYKDEISFYEESLRFNPANVPVAYNLSRSYLEKNDINSAMNIVDSVLHMSLSDPEIVNNKYFYHLVLLQYKFQEMDKK